MKFIEVRCGPSVEHRDKFINDFAVAFLRDTQLALDHEFTDQELFDLICKFIDNMAFLKTLCESKKRAEVNNIRIELHILESGAPKFLFIPLDNNGLPVVVDEQCSVMILNPSPEDARQTVEKYPKVDVEVLGENPKPPEDPTA